MLGSEGAREQGWVLSVWLSWEPFRKRLTGKSPQWSMEQQLEADLRKLERKMIRIHGEQFEPDSRPRCDVTRSATFADVASTERKRREEERRTVKNKQSMYRDQLIKTYKPLLEEELRKIDEHLPQVGTPAHRKLLTKIRTQIFVRVRTIQFCPR